MSRHPAGGIANISKVRYFENAGTKAVSFTALVSAAFESSGSVPDVDILVFRPCPLSTKSYPLSIMN